MLQTDKKNIILLMSTNNFFILEICKLLLNIKILYIVDNNNLDKSKIKSYCNDEITIIYTNEYKHNQNITIIYNINDLINISKYCTEINSKIIIGFANNGNCAVFLDIGKNYIIYDIDKSNIESISISEINDEGIVHCSTYDSHNYITDDIIYFTYIEGSNINQFKKDWKITVIDNKKFKLNNFNCTNFKINNGIIMNKKNIHYINHNNFESQLIKLDIIDLDEYSIELIETYLNSNYDKKIINNTISIMCSLIIIEINKILTGIYKPIMQWITWYDTNFNKLMNYENLDNLSNNKLNFIIFDYDTFGNNILDVLSNINNDGNIIIKTKLTLLDNKYKNIIIDNVLDLTNMNEYNNYIVVTTSTDTIKQENINKYCFTNNIALFDYNNFKIQPIIPDITDIQTWNYDNKKSYPECVLNNFPTNIHHLIIWSLYNFETYTDISNTVNKWIDDKNCFLSSNYIDKTNNLKIITNMTIVYNISSYNTKNININIAVIFAIDNFIKYYYTNIKELLKSFPEKYEIEPDVLFWSYGKICPHPIKFDNTNTYHNNYILSNTIIVLNMCNIIYDISLNDIIPYIIEYSNTIDYKNIKIGQQISNNPIDHSKKYKNTDFDKNNILHINWLIESCNIRASNYNIVINNIYDYIKNDIDLIEPMEISLINLVSNLLSCEIIKYMFNYNNYTTTNIDMIHSKINNCDTTKVSITNINGNEINIWKKNIYTLNSTLNEFKTYYEELFQMSIIMIVNESILLYADFMEEKLDKTLDEIIIDKTKNIVMLITNDIELPDITIII